MKNHERKIIKELTYSCPEAFSEPIRTFKMELFAKIDNGFQLLTSAVKNSILDVTLDSGYSSAACSLPSPFLYMGLSNQHDLPCSLFQHHNKSFEEILSPPYFKEERNHQRFLFLKENMKFSKTLSTISRHNTVLNGSLFQAIFH